ncbi:MAG: S-layer homology domain-containing protein [Firmicutes bacterium]|nr:S-layer homology domain-containing protein [Bacillota bacterium]
MRIKTKAAIAAAALAILLFVCWMGIKPASAKLFTDEDQIGDIYTEAIVYMSEKNVLVGFPDGSFRPQGTLTREQAAKIVTYMILGAEKATGLTCDGTPYKDVDAVRWSAPYIAWCSDKGILHGYGSGNFGPADTLTGMQFAKMLLCAFGNENVERYTGTNWAESVQVDGNRVGLFTGDLGMCSYAPLQRQQAALMAYNAEKMPKPSPDSGTDDTPNEHDPAPIDQDQDQDQGQSQGQGQDQGQSQGQGQDQGQDQGQGQETGSDSPDPNEGELD